MTARLRHRRGFALLAVLWTMALLALIATQIAASARTEARIASNLRRAAELQAAADAAVHVAAFRLLDHSERGWDAHTMPGPHVVVQNDVRVEVWLVDHADLINLNTNSREMLQAAFAAVGADEGLAATLADAVIAWRESALPDAVRARRDAAYRAAGRANLPPSSPFRSIDELRQVLGMPPDLVTRLAPHLSLVSNYGPAETTRDPVAAQAIRTLHRTTGYLPPPRVAMQPFFIQITALAHGADGSAFTRRVIVELDPQASDNPMTIVEWN